MILGTPDLEGGYVWLEIQNVQTIAYSFSVFCSKKSVPLQKGKALPLQALMVPGGWGFQISRQSAREGGKVVSPTHRLPLPPRKYSWYSFLLEAEWTPGPWCVWKDYDNEKFQWHHWESNCSVTINEIILEYGMLIDSDHVGLVFILLCVCEL